MVNNHKPPGGKKHRPCSALSRTGRKERFLGLLVFLFLSSFAVAQDTPPKQTGAFCQPDLVELIKLDPTLKLDIRYATRNNFTRQRVYDEARAFLQRPVAAALIRAHQKAKAKGYGFKIFDGYRPWYVTKLFWDSFPQFRAFVADPAKEGSRHNHGCAVDLTLFDLKTGREVNMPSQYDDFTERAHPDYQGGTAEQRAARDLLRAIMESESFSVYENEWWHFDYKGWQEYPIMNIRFSEIGTRKQEGGGGGSNLYLDSSSTKRTFNQATTPKHTMRKRGTVTRFMSHKHGGEEVVRGINYRSLPKRPVLSLTEERRLIAKAKRGYKAETEELILRYVGFIIFRIHKKAFPSYVARLGEDILAQAVFILYDKIKTYNLRYRDKNGDFKPVRFSSYIWKRIDGFILDSLKEELARERREVSFDW